MLYILTLAITLLSAGTLFVTPGYAIERDYFTADEDPAAWRDLTLNNQHHTNNVLKWLREGNIPMALTDVQFTIDKWPNHPRALILLEVISGVTHTPNLPIPYYEKAIRLYPQYAITRAQYGKYLVEISQVDGGIAKLQEAVTLDPKLTAAHVWLTEAYLKKGKKELARKEAETARVLGYEGELPFDKASDHAGH